MNWCVIVFFYGFLVLYSRDTSEEVGFLNVLVVFRFSPIITGCRINTTLFNKSTTNCFCGNRKFKSIEGINFLKIKLLSIVVCSIEVVVMVLV